MISHKHAQIIGYSFSDVDPDDMKDGLLFIKKPELAVYVCKDKTFHLVSANSHQSVRLQSRTGHGLAVGDWVWAGYEKTTSEPIGVVTKVEGRLFQVQLSGLWENNELPGIVGTSLYLQANGSVGVAETESYIGERTETGMVIQSRGGGGGSVDLSPLEIRISANEADIRTNLSNIGNHQTTLGDHAQRLATMEAFFVEDPDKGLIIKGDKFVDSMLVSGLFSSDTSGPGTSAGGRRTEVNFTQEVPANTDIDLHVGAYAAYSVTGVEPNIPNATALVTSPFIRMTLGPLEMDKESLTFVDEYTIRFDIPIVSGTKIVIYS